MNHTILGRLNLYDKTKLSTPIFKVDIKICALPKCIVHFGPKNIQTIGSGCDSVGRPPASNTRGLRFESSHRQKFMY